MANLWTSSASLGSQGFTGLRGMLLVPAAIEATLNFRKRRAPQIYEDGKIQEEFHSCFKLVLPGGEW
jgi:hypothetical protein